MAMEAAPRQKISYPVAKKAAAAPAPGKDCSHKKPAAAAAAARRPDGGDKTDGRSTSLPITSELTLILPCESSTTTWRSPRPSKDLARLIKRKLVHDNPAVFSGPPPAFDGRRNLYSPVELLPDRQDFLVTLPPSTDGGAAASEGALKPFRVSIKLVSKLSAEGLTRGQLPPQELLHALDVVLRESATESCTPVGRSLFSTAMGGGEDIGGAAVALRGFFQSLRPTQQGLALNVDFSKRFDFLRDLPQRKTRELAGEERRAVEKALKNLRISVCHRRSDQRFRILGLTEVSTEKLRFRDRDGKELTIVDYYRNQYDFELQFLNLPCLQISRSKPCYLPMELCAVMEGQKVLGKLSEEQTARVRKMGCQRPGKRREIIDAVMGGAAGPTSGPYAGGFNLRVSRDMTRLSGRVLPPPKLKLGDGGHVRELTRAATTTAVEPPRQPRGRGIPDTAVGPRQLRRRPRAAVLHPPLRFPARPPLQPAGDLPQQNHGSGTDVRATPHAWQCRPARVQAPPGPRRRRWRPPAVGLRHGEEARGYGDLKRIAETAVGVVTQCCLYCNVAVPASQFLANLALKINAKLGGCNMELSSPLHRQLPRVFSGEEPAIFMGADVTHPHPLDDTSPSVAAVVGSLDWPAANRYAARMRSQAHREEIIQELEDMAGEILEEFFLRGSQKLLPGRIVFFRDGVSETQFSRVLKDELSAIRAACKRFPGYQPRITFAVVQKRHHTRLFGGAAAAADENIPRGRSLTSIFAATGDEGTTRPTRYHVLWDENGFSSDELQRLIHSLCYTFARCTKPVSLVPPAYYAHLAAYRGRMYLDRSDIGGGGMAAVCRSSAPLRAPPLPKPRDSVKKLMFYC
ncbi:unnamed protein product [Spirodela intermedia]|uniref:Uncharacterized protein n=1 Tax=Spirodela intermedia TaxID=51605 RepID=A0A7I8JBP7_SPIIN|nr:unnamed protein product [Spirodela intermedia]CAA6667391.1 unnamed protein product [Spirodela intermedia]